MTLRIGCVLVTLFCACSAPQLGLSVDAGLLAEGDASVCGTCAPGTHCDSAGECTPIGTVDAGGALPDASTSSSCGPYQSPDQPSCCQSCQQGQNCQTNGCYGGWWCDSSACKCHAPPSNCGGGAPPPDLGGVPVDAGPITGTVGPNGGTVSRLFFAVVGDTRPANVDDTANYPTTVIESIYSQVAKLNPQFVITTGDYMFSTPAKNTAPAQLALYTKAAQQFKGPIFAAMGNHECNGYTDSNCAGAPTTNFNSYYDSLVKPLGQQVPYYTVPINDLNNQWTAKIVVAACNDWDATQYNWLKGELARATTYTFVVRHEPLGTAGAPCVSEMDNLLSQSKYDLFIVGHSHTFAHSQKQLTVGNGGAPLTNNVGYGYAIIEQQNAGFLISQYDVMSPNPVATFTVQ